MAVSTEAINTMINTLNNPRSVVFELARSKSSVRSNGGQHTTSMVPKGCRAAKGPEGEKEMKS